MTIALAAAAALLFALGTVLQQRAAVREPSGGPRGAASLLLRLARRLREHDPERGGASDRGAGAGGRHREHLRPDRERRARRHLFEESLHDDALGVAASVLALGVMFTGLAVLARSEGAQQEPDAPGGDARQ